MAPLLFLGHPSTARASLLGLCAPKSINFLQLLFELLRDTAGGEQPPGIEEVTHQASNAWMPSGRFNLVSCKALQSIANLIPFRHHEAPDIRYCSLSWCTLTGRSRDEEKLLVRPSGGKNTTLQQRAVVPCALSTIFSSRLTSAPLASAGAPKTSAEHNASRISRHVN